MSFSGANPLSSQAKSSARVLQPLDMNKSTAQEQKSVELPEARALVRDYFLEMKHFERAEAVANGEDYSLEEFKKAENWNAKRQMRIVVEIERAHLDTAKARAATRKAEELSRINREAIAIAKKEAVKIKKEAAQAKAKTAKMDAILAKLKSGEMTIEQLKLIDLKSL